MLGSGDSGAFPEGYRSSSDCVGFGPGTVKRARNCTSSSTSRAGLRGSRAFYTLRELFGSAICRTVELSYPSQAPCKVANRDSAPFALRICGRRPEVPTYKPDRDLSVCNLKNVCRPIPGQNRQPSSSLHFSSFLFQKHPSRDVHHIRKILSLEATFCILLYSERNELNLNPLFCLFAVFQEQRSRRIDEFLLPHRDELPGKDIVCDSDGTWHVFEDANLIVKAGTVKHTIPCFGYVIAEKVKPGR